jgi:hypothetical protein
MLYMGAGILNYSPEVYLTHNFRCLDEIRSSLIVTQFSEIKGKLKAAPIMGAP